VERRRQRQMCIRDRCKFNKKNKMKASELRIGNLVMDGKDIEQVNARMIDMLVKIEADFDPIPLTEEWLLNLGLTDLKRKNEKHFKFNDFVYVLDYGCVTYNGVIISRQDIKYVHQLQNLYFALTGEKLTLIEKT
jgi:hypothetical protein